MKRKSRLTHEDRTLFREAVEGVRPLKHNRAKPPGNRPAPIPRKRLEDDRQVLHDMLSDPSDDGELETGEELLFARAGLQRAVLRKLRRGRYALGAELDLHGMTVPQARGALAAFLHQCRAQDRRCVRVIHGKGHGSRRKEPVLKRKVDHWLRQRDEVLAFCSARPVDGGTGALYVLLKGAARG